jgi:hypothetical protein
MAVMNNVKPVDFSKLRKEHENRWVALSADSGEVVAAGDTLAEVRAKSHAEEDDLLFFRVLPPELSFAPLVHEV